MEAGGSITVLIVNYMLGGGHCLPAGKDRLEREKVLSLLIQCYQPPHTQRARQKGSHCRSASPEVMGPSM